MEHRYPVRVESFEIRRGSGGKGRNRGGNGVIRRLRFLAPVQLSVLTQRRKSGPYGMAGGGEGHPGQQWIIRRDGIRETLSSVSATALQPGDTFVIETPGGGGWGKPGT